MTIKILQRLAACASITLSAILISFSPASAGAAQQNSFALGLHMAFAAFQARAALAQPGVNDNGTHTCSAGEGLLAAEIGAMKQLAAALNSLGVSVSMPDYSTHCGAAVNEVDGLEATRTSISVQIAQQNSSAGSAFNLGVNLGVAEAQTTAGEPARQIVLLSLQNALPQAQALHLDTTILTQCISFAAGTTPLAEIHSSLISLRSGYQASL